MIFQRYMYNRFLLKSQGIGILSFFLSLLICNEKGGKHKIYVQTTIEFYSECPGVVRHYNYVKRKEKGHYKGDDKF